MAAYIRKTGLFLTLLLVVAALAIGLAWQFGAFASSPAGDQSQANEQPQPARNPDTATTNTNLPDGPTGITEPEILAYLHKLTPAQRITWLGKVLNKDRDCKPVARDAISLTIAEQGTLITDSVADVAVLVSGTIREIVADGVMVKKGDKLVEIDDKSRKESLQKKNIQYIQCSAAHQQANAAYTKVLKDAQSVFNEANLEWKLADLILKRFKGEDAEQKKKLQLTLEKTQQAMERAKAQVAAVETKAIADVLATKANLDRASVELLVLEGELGRCHVVAPRQGMVVYHLPPQEKDGETTFPSLRPGETVSAGQLLMRICDDLGHLFLTANIDAVHAGQVKPGQKAFVRIPALPNRVFAAKVKSVGAATKARGAKGLVLPTKIELQGNVSELRPLMAGSVLIVVDERPSCLRLPLTNVVGKGKDKVCFVLSGNELHLRAVTTGLANNQYVEVLSGLEDGEQVLGLQGVLGRQAEYLKYK